MSANDLRSMREVLIKSLADHPIGLAVIETIDEVISASSRFNFWFGTDAKRSLNETELIALLDEYGTIVDSYKSGYQAVVAKAPGAVDQFLSTLRSARDRLRSLTPSAPA